jgi:hypothetical protein
MCEHGCYVLRRPHYRVSGKIADVMLIFRNSHFCIYRRANDLQMKSAAGESHSPLLYDIPPRYESTKSHLFYPGGSFYKLDTY